MRNKKDYYVVSVESRKGGVGKTSVALNLARLLVRSGKYEVLFLDLDIVGTEAAECIPALEEVSEPFSKDLLYLLQSPDKKKIPKVLNLIEVFENYMAGKPIVPAQWDGESQKNVVLKQGRVNVFSSSLFRDCGGNGRGYTYGPATLFDDMHSRWFISMIKDFVVDCTEKMYDSKENHEKKMVVVIDNSPGYSGLAPVVDEWLTDIGPKYGKFLFVCSTDTQDMTACLKSIRENHKLYAEKWKISRDFIDMFQKSEKNEEYLGEGKGKAFFNRLAESIPDDYNLCQYENYSLTHTDCTHCALCFYRQENAGEGKEYVDNAEKFLALTANRVPKSICDGDLTIVIDDFLRDMGLTPEKDLTLKRLKKFVQDMQLQDSGPGIRILLNLEENLIPHKDKMSLQFVAKRLARDVNKETQQLLEKLDEIKDDFFENFDKFQGMDLSVKEAIKNSIEKGIELELAYHNKLNDLRSRISKVDIVNVNDNFWDDKYSILFTDLELVNTLGKINEQRVGSYSGIELEELITKLKRIPEYQKESKQAAAGLEKIMALPEVKEIGIPKDVLRDIGLAAVKVNDDCFNMNADKCKEMMIILCYMYIVCYIWEKNRGEVDLSSLAYWEKHSSDRERINSAVHEYPQLKKMIDDNVENLFIDEDKYPDLYMKFCKMRVRLMDAAMDFELLIKIFKNIILEKDPGHTFYGQMHDLADKMIVEKSFVATSREEILKEIPGLDSREFELKNLVSLNTDKEGKFFIPTEEITVFDDVIKRIVEGQWSWLLA